MSNIFIKRLLILKKSRLKNIVLNNIKNLHIIITMKHLKIKLNIAKKQKRTLNNE